MNYRERLSVPVSWWMMLVAMTASIWVVFHHVYGPTVSIPVAAAVLIVGVAGLVRYGALTIRVADGAITVGRARLPLSATGSCEALTGEAARAARGLELNPTAYIAIRGYVSGIARIEIVDTADPTPYWLISTRRPERLVAELEAARRQTG